MSLYYHLINYKKLKEKNVKKELEFIDVKQYKLIIIDLISVFIFILYLNFFIKAIGGISALADFSNAMIIYRSKTLFHQLTLIPGWVNFMSKICRAVAYIYTYILINNLIIKKRKDCLKQKNLFLYILGILVYLPITVMSGGRYDLIVYILFIIIIWSIIYTIEHKKKLQPNKIIKIGIIIFIILIAFSNFKGLVGRSSDSSSDRKSVV